MKYKYGPLRQVVEEVMEKFIHCGTLECGFAHVRCDHCRQEYLLAFFCKGRWFCLFDLGGTGNLPVVVGGSPTTRRAAGEER